MKDGGPWVHERIRLLQAWASRFSHQCPPSKCGVLRLGQHVLAQVVSKWRGCLTWNRPNVGHLLQYELCTPRPRDFPSASTPSLIFMAEISLWVRVKGGTPWTDWCSSTLARVRCPTSPGSLSSQLPPHSEDTNSTTLSSLRPGCVKSSSAERNSAGVIGRFRQVRLVWATWWCLSATSSGLSSYVKNTLYMGTRIYTMV